jgi:uncharacterized membrane protein YeaQ/YmgE (transglycosylase-associated protein family)
VDNGAAHEWTTMDFTQILILAQQIFPTLTPFGTPFGATPTPQIFTPSPLDQTIIVQFTLGSALTAIIIGIVSGFLASLFVRGRTMNVLSTMVVGLLGALVGNFLFGLLNVPISPALLDGITLRFIDIVVSFIGAVLILIFVLALFGSRRR